MKKNRGRKSRVRVPLKGYLYAVKKLNIEFKGTFSLNFFEIIALKGQCHVISTLGFFSSKYPPL
jgi:hypothetical protein